MNSFLRMIPVMVAGLLLLGAARPEGAPSLSPYRHYDSNTFIHGNFKPSFQKQWKASAERLKNPPSEGAVMLPLAVSSFRKVTDPVLPKRLAESVKSLGPEERAGLEGALLQLYKGYEQTLDQQDQPQLKNNLAGAFNFLFTSSFCALRNGQELTGVQQQSMLEQINAAIGMGLKDRRMSDRDKQELYESVVLSGSIILGLYNEGRDKGRSDLMRESRELAKELLDEMMGIRIEKVHAEDTGVWIE
ncbi:MAG TPA: DUF6683 family protein [Archangium sp.]|uniref:DUF6683 family protein n=1 Tax=Archangium sp. TaxID=1872627 RepID=UPI002E33EBE1|nr:DUF6683 family protein [Archangium sp.]HEX5750493.1 DUF6683 family protein [Archangium sp.]